MGSGGGSGSGMRCMQCLPILPFGDRGIQETGGSCDPVRRLQRAGVLQATAPPLAEACLGCSVCCAVLLTDRDRDRDQSKGARARDDRREREKGVQEKTRRKEDKRGKRAKNEAGITADVMRKRKKKVHLFTVRYWAPLCLAERSGRRRPSRGPMDRVPLPSLSFSCWCNRQSINLAVFVPSSLSSPHGDQDGNFIPKKEINPIPDPPQHSQRIQKLVVFFKFFFIVQINTNIRKGKGIGISHDSAEQDTPIKRGI